MRHMNMTGFRCTACDKQLGVDYSDFVCPACGGNLDVTYAYDEIRKQLDKARPFPSARNDIFKYMPLLPVNDVSLAPPLRIGATPLYHAQRLGASIGLNNLWLKDDGLNPSASFKDRASSVALTRARELKA
ncbi:MAG: pyridoxal-phosphate dependent enzyme, partial [Spartobacteria bacterium]|nr:pyridoxal-phosphate dependent enzyme [Spartobacteria bacterium]